MPTLSGTHGPRARGTLRAATGGIAVAAVLSACGGSGDEISSGPPPALAQAYKQTTGSDTLTISLQGAPATAQSPTPQQSPQGQPQQQQFSGEAQLDYADNASTSEISLPGQPTSQTRVVDGIQYRKVPQEQREQVPEEKPWIKVDVEQVAKVQYGDRAADIANRPPSDPAGMLVYLRGVVGGSKTGTETIRGVQTTHYRATVNLDQAVAGQGPTVQQQTTQLKQQLGKPTLPMQVWLDGQNRVRKLKATVPSGGQAQGPQQGQQAQQSRMTLAEEFYDYDKKLDISTPDEDKTADLTQQVVQRQQMQQQQQQQQQPPQGPPQQGQQQQQQGQ